MYWLSHLLFWLGKRLARYTFPKIGHAPALMDPAQLAIIEEFLRLATGGSAHIHPNAMERNSRRHPCCSRAEGLCSDVSRLLNTPRCS